MCGGFDTPSLAASIPTAMPLTPMPLKGDSSGDRSVASRGERCSVGERLRGDCVTHSLTNDETTRGTNRIGRAHSLVVIAAERNLA